MKDRFLWIAAGSYATLFTVLGSLKYNVHRNLVDFGIFAQTTASAFGCFCNTVEGSHYAVHFSPVLYLAGAVVWLVRSPYTLIALQSVACALVLPPVYALVRSSADQNIARLAMLVALLYPALAGLAFNDFHENDFAPAAVLWMLWAFDRGYVVATYLLAALTLGVKEDQAVFLAVAGFLGYVRFRTTACGRVALIVCLAASLVALQYFWFIQPTAAASSHWAPVRFYAWTSADVRQMFFAGISARLGFVLLAFLPLLFLPFRSRWMFVAALPLAEVLLSRMPTTFTMGSHYAGAWIGWALAAFAFAVRALPERRARDSLRWCVAFCALEFLVANPLHPGLNLRGIEARDLRLDTAIASLPNDIAVSTQEEAYTHMAISNPNAGVLPELASLPVKTPFVLIDGDFPDSPRLQEYARALHRPCFVPVRSIRSIVLYRTLCPVSKSSLRKPVAARSGHPAAAAIVSDGAAHGAQRAV
ncbi:MAG: DUF2079 domain-containing protein [Candidatus Baltobacteraceae bacterium]